MRNYYKSPDELEWIRYNKSKLHIAHYFRIISYINKLYNEVLHVRYRGKHFNHVIESDKSYDKKANFIKCEITDLLNNLTNVNLSFEHLQSWELNPIEVAITQIGNNTVMVILEETEIGLLVFKDNYHNPEFIIKKFKEGYYNTILSTYTSYSSFLGVYKV